MNQIMHTFVLVKLMMKTEITAYSSAKVLNDAEVMEYKGIASRNRFKSVLYMIKQPIHVGTLNNIITHTIVILIQGTKYGWLCSSRKQERCLFLLKA